jgi:hypothetical protein
VGFDTASKSAANLGFQQTPWQAADKLRSNADAAEYKHVVLGLIFLKYISDASGERRAAIERETHEPDRDLYVRGDRPATRLWRTPRNAAQSACPGCRGKADARSFRRARGSPSSDGWLVMRWWPSNATA